MPKETKGVKMKKSKPQNNHLEDRYYYKKSKEKQKCKKNKNKIKKTKKRAKHAKRATNLKISLSHQLLVLLTYYPIWRFWSNFWWKYLVFKNPCIIGFQKSQGDSRLMGCYLS